MSNSKYEKYFTKLNSNLKKFNNKFLYYIPNIYKRDLRKDEIFEPKFKFHFLENFLDADYLCKDINKIKNAKLCFISHYVGNKDRDKNIDFYYGDLLKKKNIKIPFYLLLINHTDEKLEDIENKFKNSKITRVYVDNKFGFISDLSIFFKITKEYLLFQVSKFKNSKNIISLNKMKITLNYKDFFSSRYTYRISNRVFKILNISNKLSNLVTTYEGHAYEKIIFNYCNKNNIKSFGYFFSVIREYKNSVYYNFLNYDPDVILTSGTVAKKDLKVYLPNKDIQVLGGNKKVSKKSYSNKSYKNIKKKATILVCPEGIYSETIKLFELINNEKLISNKFQFIFRVHPVLNSSDIFKKKLFNKNIKFSYHNNINDDFKQSDMILYSGSSVCVQAVGKGLIPINYKNVNSEFSRDPLYQVNKFVIKNKDELKSKLISIIKNKKNVSLKYNMYKLKKYSDLYFTKINHNVLNKKLNYTSKFIKRII